MENFDTNKQVKDKRQGTFGSTPQAGEPQMPEKKEVIQDKEDPRKNKQNKLAQLKQEKEKRKTIPADQAPSQETKFVKGLQVGVTEDGFLKMIPFGETNYLDIVAMAEYVRAKKDDILAELSASKVHQVNKETSAIAKAVKQLLDAVGE